MEVTEKDTVKLASIRTGEGEVPQGKCVAYEHLKPVKVSTLHRHTEELMSDSSSTDTDIELSQREETSTRPVGPHVPLPPDTTFSSNNEESGVAGVAEHSLGKDDIILIGCKPRAERKAVCQPPVSASLQDRSMKSMIEILHKREWLNDYHINHCQALLKHQFPGVDGLQNCLIFQAEDYSLVGIPSNKFVQILHFLGNHWITISNIHSSHEGELKIYASLYTKVGKPHRQKFIEQLGWLLHTPSHAITLEWPDVQRQTDGRACGLFAIANAYALCNNMKPEDCAWDQNGLDDWLEQCLRDEGMFPPPVTMPHRKSKGIVHTEVERVYCTCRLPNNKAHGMIACDGCGEWYHLKCEGVTSKITRKKFHCSICRYLFECYKTEPILFHALHGNIGLVSFIIILDILSSTSYYYLLCIIVHE